MIDLIDSFQPLPKQGHRFQVPGEWGLGSRFDARGDQSSEFGLQIPESSIQKFRVLVHHLKTKQIKTNQNEIKIKVKDSRQTDRHKIEEG